MQSTALRFKTYVHISDIHIGDIEPTSGNAQLDASAEQWWRLHTLFDGFLGHAHVALDALVWFFDDLRIRENAQLVVTGDITTLGAASQFDLAEEYLRRAIELDPGNFVGLNCADAYDCCIPGNHDHWPGRRSIVGGATPRLRATFPVMPMEMGQIDVGNGRIVTLCGIDTDADVWPFGPSRVFARGSFANELQALERTLGAPQAAEVRVLLLHHSRMSPYGPLGIEGASMRQLERFIDQHRVAVLLSGHHHVPRFDIVNRSAHQMLEARCGTTTQRAEPPDNWNLSAQEAAQRFVPNSLLVHRLYEEGGRVFWESEVFVRGELGFEKPIGKSRTAPSARVELFA